MLPGKIGSLKWIGCCQNVTWKTIENQNKSDYQAVAVTAACGDAQPLAGDTLGWLRKMGCENSGNPCPSIKINKENYEDLLL